MAKLVPNWGLSAQPGSTYYLQKFNHDVFGIVEHGSNLSTEYLFDECAGPKNTDHNISYLTQNYQNGVDVCISSWIIPAARTKITT